MKCIRLACLLSLLFAPSAMADSCDTLIDTTQSALAGTALSSSQRSQLESILSAGRAAKISGDTAACEAAMTSSTLKPEDHMSPMPQLGPGGTGGKCNKSLNTV